VQPSINLLEFYETFWAIKVCSLAARHSQIMPFSSSFFNHGRPTCHFVENFLFLDSDFLYSFYWLQVAFGNSRNIFPHFFILYAISLQENMQWSESWESTENNSLATSSSTWQTEDYFFNKEFYLNTLNPKETQWKHLLYIWSRFFIDKLSWNLCSLRANVSVPLRRGLSTWSPMARWWPAVLLCASRCVI